MLREGLLQLEVLRERAHLLEVAPNQISAVVRWLDSWARRTS
jgi:hypothetical protein